MLTDTKLRNLTPRDKLFRIADGLGLCIEVKPAGPKLWRYRCRHSGIAKMLSLSRYPEASLREVHQKRDKARKLLCQRQRPVR